MFQAKSPRRELNERRHFSTGSGEIPHEFLTAHLRFVERNRGHIILHPQIVDEATACRVTSLASRMLRMSLEGHTLCDGRRGQRSKQRRL
jgi:hypothetical protein